MCDGFSEAFMAAAAGASEGVGAMAGGYTAMAGAGEALGSAATFAASNAASLASVGSAVLSGTAAYTQANAQQQAAKYQAQVEQNNAQLALFQRSAALQQGDLQAQQSALQTAQLLGQQKAALAANGVDLSSGSAIDQLASSHFLGEQAVNTLQSNAARAAWGYQVQGQTAQTQATLSGWEASRNNPLAIASLTGGATLLTQASQFAGQGT